MSETAKVEKSFKYKKLKNKTSLQITETQTITISYLTIQRKRIWF